MKKMARLELVIFVMIVGIVVARRRKVPEGCNTDDITQFGGSAAQMMSSFERCLPEVVNESNMDVVEGCAITTFSPDNISDRCKKCGMTFLDNNELNLKLCFVKCSGEAKSTNPCRKCKDEIQLEWDTSCFSNASGQPQDAYDDKGVSSPIIIYVVVTILTFI